MNTYNMEDRYKIDPYDEEYWNLEEEEEEDDDFFNVTGIAGDPPLLPHVAYVEQNYTGTSGSSGSSGIRDIKQERMKRNYNIHNKYLKQNKFKPTFKNNTRHK